MLSSVDRYLSLSSAVGLLRLLSTWPVYACQRPQRRHTWVLTMGTKCSSQAWNVSKLIKYTNYKWPHLFLCSAHLSKFISRVVFVGFKSASYLSEYQRSVYFFTRISIQYVAYRPKFVNETNSVCESHMTNPQLMWTQIDQSKERKWTII